MITIPEKYYVGFQGRSAEDKGHFIPLGFPTPFDTTKAFEKRKDTVDRWAKPSWEKRQDLPPKTIDNVLVEGFKIAEDVRRVYWGGGNVVWRMIDPRGWQFEITSSNLARILDCTTVENGVIKGKCLLGRDKAQNVLLPENSEPYQDATKNTIRANKKISTKDVKPGDTVVLKDGREGTYLGYYHVAYAKAEESRGYHSGWNRTTKTVTTDFLVTNKRHFFQETVTEELKNSQRLYSNEVGDIVNTASADIHISEIKKIADKAIDTTEMAKEITKGLRGISSWNNLTDAYLVSEKQIKGKAKVKLVPYSYGQVVDVIQKKTSGRLPFIVALLDGIYGTGLFRLQYVSPNHSTVGLATSHDFVLSKVLESDILSNTLVYEYLYRYENRPKGEILSKYPWKKVVIEFDGEDYTPMMY